MNNLIKIKKLAITVAQLLSAIVAGATPLVWAVATHPGI